MAEKKESRLEAVTRLLGEGKSIKQVAEELGISERLVRSYKWRAEHPEEFKAMLDRYYAKRKARLAEKPEAAEVKPKAEKPAAKTKKPKTAKKQRPAEAAEIEEPEASEEKDVTRQSAPVQNPWR